MATIKIYSSGVGPDSIEFGNEGDSTAGEMLLTIDSDEHKKDYLYFSLTEYDARELIRYFKDQFGINLNLIK